VILSHADARQERIDIRVLLRFDALSLIGRIVLKFVCV